MRPAAMLCREAEAQVLLVRLLLAALPQRPGPKLVASAQRAAETGRAGLRCVLPCGCPVRHNRRGYIFSVQMTYLACGVLACIGPHSALRNILLTSCSSCALRSFALKTLRGGVSRAVAELTLSNLLAIDSAWPVAKTSRRILLRPTAEHQVPQDDLRTIVGKI